MRGGNESFQIYLEVFFGAFRQVLSVTMPASLPPQLAEIPPKILSIYI